MININTFVRDHYNLVTEDGVKLLSGGLIHATYKFSAGGVDYIIQKLHPVLSDVTFGEDMENVCKHLQKKGLLAPTVLRNDQGSVHTEGGGNSWRLYTFITGTVVETVSRPRIAQEAGAMLARFHNAMRDFDLEIKKPLFLHDSKAEYQKLLKAIEADPKAYAEIKEHCDFIARELPPLFLPEGLPTTIVHGDPKITNFLFDGDTATAMIDLDTTIRHSPLVDLGDALRSWCGGMEDDPNNPFNEEIFKAAILGYTSEASLNNEEKALLEKSMLLITLELATRFLADYINDSYFGFDKERYPNRKAHNLARAVGQIALYKNAKEKLGA